jgi:hypothetical protein
MESTAPDLHCAYIAVGHDAVTVAVKEHYRTLKGRQCGNEL